MTRYTIVKYVQNYEPFLAQVREALTDVPVRLDPVEALDCPDPLDPTGGQERRDLAVRLVRLANKAAVVFRESVVHPGLTEHQA